jgi:Protein of unknown function (DUF1257)
MSSVIVLAPLIVGGWPVITAAVTAAIATMGFSVATAAASNRRVRTANRAEMEVENSEILASEAGIEQSLVVERDGVRATFSRDARGALKVCMEGNASKNELKRIGDELLGRVTQQYAYHRIVSELKERNMTIVDEELQADQAVRIRVRNF